MSKSAAAAPKSQPAAGPKPARSRKPPAPTAAPPDPGPEPDIDEAPSGTGPVIPGEEEISASEAANAAALAGEADPEPTVQSEPEPEPDIESEEVVSGEEVPVYNPLPIPQTHQHCGIFYTVRARGVDLMPAAAALHAVGPENDGGVLSMTGMRRLYGPEPRFQPAADAAGVSLVEWASRRNEAIVEEANAVGAAWADKHGLQDDTVDNDEA